MNDNMPDLSTFPNFEHMLNKFFGVELALKVSFINMETVWVSQVHNLLCCKAAFYHNNIVSKQIANQFEVRNNSTFKLKCSFTQL
jgi:hypothetical protein